MPDEQILRERAQTAIRAGTLPVKRPDRTWTGPGIGFPCAVCAQLVRHHDRETQMQFEHVGRVPGLDTFHLDLRCFAMWELERRRAPGKPGA